jgi:hypothetical protein
MCCNSIFARVHRSSLPVGGSKSLKYHIFVCYEDTTGLDLSDQLGKRSIAVFVAKRAIPEAVRDAQTWRDIIDDVIRAISGSTNATRPSLSSDAQNRFLVFLTALPIFILAFPSACSILPLSCAVLLCLNLPICSRTFPLNCLLLPPNSALLMRPTTLA